MSIPSAEYLHSTTYFFTLRLADRTDDLLTRHIGHLRRAMRDTIKRYPFHIDAIVVLPAVIHTIWTLPPGAQDYPNRIGMLKSRFSRDMPFPAYRTPGQIQRGEKGIWQKRYWEHQIVDAADFARHRAMIHHSPVQAGLCEAPRAWPYSSLHRDADTDATCAPIFAPITQIPLVASTGRQAQTALPFIS